MFVCVSQLKQGRFALENEDENYSTQQIEIVSSQTISSKTRSVEIITVSITMCPDCLTIYTYLSMYYCAVLRGQLKSSKFPTL